MTEEWRSVTHGEMYDMRLERLKVECDELKILVTRVPPVGDMSIDKYFEKIKEMVEELRKIKSDASLPILMKKLKKN